MPALAQTRAPVRTVAGGPERVTCYGKLAEAFRFNNNDYQRKYYLCIHVQMSYIIYDIVNVCTYDCTNMARVCAQDKTTASSL